MKTYLVKSEDGEIILADVITDAITPETKNQQVMDVRLRVAADDLEGMEKQILKIQPLTYNEGDLIEIIKEANLNLSLVVSPTEENVLFEATTTTTEEG